MSGAVARRPAAAAAKAPPRAPQGRGMASVMNFYTDDSPGIKMSPSLVVMMSVGFIAFVTVLHIIGKLRGL